MGSSAMGATLLTKKLKEAGVDVDVPHYAINDIPEDTEVVVTQASLVERVRSKLPDVVIFSITNFMGGEEYDKIVEELK
jgi:PTS system mannitol-specific IIC component